MIKLWQALRLPFEHFTWDEEKEEYTDTPSFADDVLKIYEEDERLPLGARRAVGAARRAKAIRSLRSKFLLKYRAAIGAGDLLRYSLHQLGQDDYGTVTGRFSSSNVNIQQVFKPSKQKRKIGVGDWPIRRLFLPREGRRWLAADARQIELRVAAHYCAEVGMTRIADLYNAPPAKNDKGAWVAGPDIDFHDVVVDIVRMERDLTKNFSFMLLFGGGVSRAMEMTGHDESTTRAELDEYNRLFPEFTNLRDQVTELAEKRGWVKTVSGRRRHFSIDKAMGKKVRYYSALNAIIQGSAGDANKVKLVELYENRAELGVDLFFTVHDEADMDYQDPAVPGRVRELLDRQSLPFRVPILWEIATGPNWADLDKLKEDDKFTRRSLANGG
jgi:DNA polymerase I